MTYKSLWLFSKVLLQNPILLLKIACFSRHIVMGIYVGDCIRTGNLHRKQRMYQLCKRKGFLQARSLAIYVICVPFCTY